MRRIVNQTPFIFFVGSLCALNTGAHADSQGNLDRFIEDSADVAVETHAKIEYLEAAASYRDLLADLDQINLDELGPDDRVDAALLEAQLRTHLYEIEELHLFELVPVSYLNLPATNSLFVRPCSQPDKVVASARDDRGVISGRGVVLAATDVRRSGVGVVDPARVRAFVRAAGRRR